MSKFNSIVDGSAECRREPYFVPDDENIPLEHFYVPAHYAGTLKSLLVPHGVVSDRIEKIAHDIVQDYKGRTIHLLCVLKGGSTFFNNLCEAIRQFHDYARNEYLPFTVDYVRVKSYEGTESTGKVQISGCDVSKLSGKHVLFVEDIIDTGLTMSSLLKYLHENIQPASVRVVSLVEKRTHRSCGFKADYVGFSIPDVFVVGYGMDFNEVYRDIKHLAIVNEVGYQKYRDFDI